jgi:hypothetical protein
MPTCQQMRSTRIQPESGWEGLGWVICRPPGFRLKPLPAGDGSQLYHTAGWLLVTMRQVRGRGDSQPATHPAGNMNEGSAGARRDGSDEVATGLMQHLHIEA